MVSLSLQGGDGLRLCTQIKAIDRLRQTPVLLITDADETQRLMRALDLGVNDYIIRPIDVNELRARVRTQLRRKLYAGPPAQHGLERGGARGHRPADRALQPPLPRCASAVGRRRAPMRTASRSACSSSTSTTSRAINDTYGHDAGDDVLRGFADRLRRGVRGIDLVARYGGEEFVLVMPETDADFAAVGGGAAAAATWRSVPVHDTSRRRAPRDGQHRHWPNGRGVGDTAKR